MDPLNVTAKFAVCSFTLSWDNSDCSFGLGLRTPYKNSVHYAVKMDNYLFIYLFIYLLYNRAFKYTNKTQHTAMKQSKFNKPQVVMPL